MNKQDLSLQNDMVMMEVLKYLLPDECRSLHEALSDQFKKTNEVLNPKDNGLIEKRIETIKPKEIKDEKTN